MTFNEESSSDSSSIIYDSQDISVVFDNSKGPLKGKSLEEFIPILKAKVKDRVKQAYIFGSVATGKDTNSSDLDLILVVETSKNFFERYKDFEDLYEIVNSMDLLVYTPKEFLVKKNESDNGFWKSVFDEAIEIWSAELPVLSRVERPLGCSNYQKSQYKY